MRGGGNGSRALRETRQRSPANGAAAPEPAVRLVGIVKSFGKREVLKGVNFSVAPGELVEVTGVSGSGKTTLLRLVHGQLSPNAGEVYVRGNRLNRWWRRGLGRLRRDVAFVFQEQRLLPRLNAFENLVLALQLRDPQVPNRTIKQRALAALESVRLGDRPKAYPHQLSAGERQRVAIARALAARPDVLVCDEAVSSLDVSVQAQILNLIAELRVSLGLSVLFISHDLAVVRQASQRVYVLYQGRIAEQGHTGEVLSDPAHDYTRRLMASVPAGR